ncbi:alkaline phosphatase [candidate division KSB1 bacterium]|nr:alkaline phosphatase [candidate division KSB1 bacterium]RQW05552.1 MAG: alkaline phosphatase [candidate division KSB1 bacterium]
MKKQRVMFLLALMILSVIFACSSQSEPKNVIIIIGDGAGFNQLQAGSLYLYGDENALTPHKFPVKLAATTYSMSGAGYKPALVIENFDYLKEKCTDSAASGTALSTGSKTYNGAIGVDTLRQPLKHLFEVAEEKGKSTGVVTSVPLSHATPAAFVAHNENRGNYHEIAEEMIQRSAVDVIIGCGHPFYNDDNFPLPEPEYKYLSQTIWDAVKDGSAGGDADGDGQADPWTFIESRDDFQKLNEGEAPRRLIGIPQVASTLQANRTGADGQTEPFSPPFTDNVPTLAEMSLAAINVLDENPSGFYLMIEAGAIDWACHANNAPRLVEEVIDMEKAVQAVVDWIESSSSWEETLVVITADHETGYITGPASGPVEKAASEIEIVYQPLVNNGKGTMPGLEFHSGGHTNSLVPVYARGAGAQEFAEIASQTDPQRGSYLDNTDIPRVIKTFLE